MNTPLILTIAASLAATSAPALAQYYPQDREYEAQMRQYEAQRAEYEARQRAYEQARRDYDRRYGAGAYSRYYAAPVAPRVYDNRYDNRYDNGYDNRYDNRNDQYAYGYGDDPYRYYSSTTCERNNSNRGANTFAGGLIGALAGAAIGSNIADRERREEGAVLGAFVGAAIGGSVANNASSDRYNARCDGTGYYYSYDQTYPYRESTYDVGRRSGRYDRSYYERQQCRLAVAPTWVSNQPEYRYVRVCPDRTGRYRITS